MTGPIVILGIFAADVTFRSDRQPRLGETVLAKSLALGPGGKGSNQAVAAARLGGEVEFITKLGDDAFAELAVRTWREAGVRPAVATVPGGVTGAASIVVDNASGENAIVVCPGVASGISIADIDAEAARIRGASVFMTQLEVPLDAAVRGLEIAREAGTTTILNPAPAAVLPSGALALCDYVVPNETEVELLTGIRVAEPSDAREAADALLESGAGAVVVTLGERGALYHSRDRTTHVAAADAGSPVETTGAGDAFNGAFATLLSRGGDPVDAVRFACAAAGISVTRPGTASSMPNLAEVRCLLDAAPGGG